METYSKADFPLTIGNDPVSDLKVMKSAAGYYIGRSYFDTEFGFEGPYSRESGYMTEADANQALLDMNFEVRDCIENAAAYASGEHPHPMDEMHEMQEEFHAWQQLCEDEERADQERWDAEADAMDDGIPF